MARNILKLFGALFVLFIMSLVVMGIYTYVDLGSSSKRSDRCTIAKFENSKNVDVRVAYIRETNYIEPYKSRIREDIARVKEILSILPLIGETAISLSAQSRYGYEFQATSPDIFGEYSKDINYAFVNMEDQGQVEQGILHEMGGHYLSAKHNSENLNSLTPDQVVSLTQAEDDLVSSIKRYKNNKNYQDALDRVEDKLSLGLFMISWEELVDVANSYASNIWDNPSSYKEFRGTAIDQKAVEERADKELYAEFTAYLLRAQKKGLFDCSYEHPVLKIFKTIKAQ